MSEQSANLYSSQRPPMPNKVRYFFGIGEMGQNFYNVMMNYFLLVFYTDVFGISAAQAATMMLVARIWDAINDPMMGVILDRTPSKMGKSRFWMSRMAIPCAIFLCLTFTTPNLSPTGKLIWAYVTYIGLGMCYTATGISYNSLLARVTRNPMDRVHLQRSRNLFGVIVGLFASGLTTKLIGIAGNGNEKLGYTIITACYGAFMVFTYFVVVRLTKGEEPPATPAEIAAAKEKGGTRKAFKALMKNDLWILLAATTLIYYGNSAMSQTVMAYYTRLCMGNPAMMAYAAVISRLGSFVCVLTCSWFAKKLGRGRTATLALSVQMCIMLIRFITKDANGYVMLGCMAVSGVFSALFLMMHTPCLMDSIDYGEWKTGVRSDGLLMSANSLGNKIGSAIGGSAVGYLLAFTGYKKELKVQPEAVVENVRRLTLITPIVIMAIVICLYAVYRKKYEPLMPRVREEMAARKAKELSESGERQTQ